MDTLVRERFEVTGVVQGVGFRPFVYRVATGLGLVGEVGNDAGGVFIHVAGSEASLDTFEERLVQLQPPLARIDSITRAASPAAATSGFRIVESAASQPGPRTLVSPDTAVCDECLREMSDPSDRRFGHPFITCTDCGPRFTIIRELPYDRPATSMAEFEMCAACSVEYNDPADRRYHAQPIACHHCGPILRFDALSESTGAVGAIEAAAAALLAGGIVAIKGLGGFHLACDATNASAVAELRRRKHRPNKPFAIMAPSLDVSDLLATISDDESDLMCSPARPVVLSTARSGSPVVAGVTAGNPLIGIMLPYTPIHHLLFGCVVEGKRLGPLVMTSGNLGGEPIVYRDDDVHRIAHLVDGVLTHDRPIEVPCDDSVVRVVDGDLLPIRRARGYAPIPVAMPHSRRSVLAVGGELKNTFTLVTDGQAWVSQHIGDMETLETQRAFEASVERMCRFHGLDEKTETTADCHPGYATSRWARSKSDGVVAVQHHHAHVASAMAEHGLAPTTAVLGFAFDGTGYGTDGSIWGGEVFDGSALGFDRVAHLRPVPLPGGDAAIRYPNRMALAHLHATGIDWHGALAPVRSTTDTDRTLLRAQFNRNLGCTPCTSMGRLFDSVASLLDLRHEISYEAQAAIELEILATHAASARRYSFDFDGEVIDQSPVLRAIVSDLDSGVDPGSIAAGFHNAVAEVVAEIAAAVTDRSTPIVLTGGCFQNALLLRRCRNRLNASGFTVLTHHIVPPNDGGLSLGQAFIAAHREQASCA